MAVKRLEILWIYEFDDQKTHNLVTHWDQTSLIDSTMSIQRPLQASLLFFSSAFGGCQPLSLSAMKMKLHRRDLPVKCVEMPWTDSGLELSGLPASLMWLVVTCAWWWVVIQLLLHEGTSQMRYLGHLLHSNNSYQHINIAGNEIARAHSGLILALSWASELSRIRYVHSRVSWRCWNWITIHQIQGYCVLNFRSRRVCTSNEILIPLFARLQAAQATFSEWLSTRPKTRFQSWKQRSKLTDSGGQSRVGLG